jgi:hypothetical protein
MIIYRETCTLAAPMFSERFGVIHCSAPGNRAIFMVWQAA